MFIFMLYIFPSSLDHTAPTVAVHQGMEVVAVDTAEKTLREISCLPLAFVFLFLIAYRS